MKKHGKLLSALLPLITLAFIFTVWSVAAAVTDNEYILPSVPSVAEEFILLFTQADFYVAFAMTLLRSVIAFACSFCLAFAAAYGAVKSSVFKGLFMPVLRIIRALPTIAVILLLLFWTTSSAAAVIVTMLVVFPTLFSGLYEAFSGIDGEVIEMCRLYKVPRKRVILRVELPAAAPALLSWVGSGLSLNLKLMVAAEVLGAASKSLGYLLSTAKYNAEIPVMIALVAVSVIAGLIIESVFGFLSKRAGRWQ